MSKAFPFVKLDGRRSQTKPRITGLTLVKDYQTGLGALEDTLPTPSIRKLWYGTKVDATCKVCKSGQQCSLSHVLARCPVALEQGRFKWRHDSILLQIFKIVREARNKGCAKFKLNQKKAHTQGRSKQVTVNGDIFHEFPSERDTPSEMLYLYRQYPRRSTSNHVSRGTPTR